MNDAMFRREPARPDRPTAPTRVADAAGMIWGHSNPAELYRWISRRNELLRTIAEAFPARPARPFANC